MDNREVTIASFVDTVRYQAIRLAASRPHIVIDDLIQDGYVALLECYDRFTESFQTVAPYYLKKALHEGVYRQIGGSTNVRRFAAKVDKTRSALRLELWCEPSDAEIAHAMGLTEARLQQRLLTVRVMHTVCGTGDEPSAQYWNGKRIASNSHPGECNGNAKLTADQVREIRARAAQGESRKTLQQAYGLSKTPIAKIIRGEVWAHVSRAACSSHVGGSD